MLNVYSRYCRFFIGDSEMILLYKKEITKFHSQNNNNILQWLYDLIELEKPQILNSPVEQSLTMIGTQYLNDFGDTEYVGKLVELISIKQGYQREIEASETLNFSDAWFMKDSSALFDTFDETFYVSSETDATPNATPVAGTPFKKLDWRVNFQDYTSQRFPFCCSIMQHLLKNPYVSQKLYQTCKYFNAVYKTPTCCSLRIGDKFSNNKYENSSIHLSPTYFDTLIEDSKIHQNLIILDHHFVVAQTLDISNSTNPRCFSQILDFKIFDIKYLSLRNQHITLDEIVLINKTCKLISVKLVDVSVSTPDGGPATMQEVVQQLHRVQKIALM